jgi:hypothetical protein
MQILSHERSCAHPVSFAFLTSLFLSSIIRPIQPLPRDGTLQMAAIRRRIDFPGVRAQQQLYLKEKNA